MVVFENLRYVEIVGSSIQKKLMVYIGTVQYYMDIEELDWRQVEWG